MINVSPVIDQLTPPRIEISPAILTADVSQLVKIASTYSRLAVSQIDIDVAEQQFARNSTLTLAQIVDSLPFASLSQRIGIHLMLREPSREISLINQVFRGREFRVYVHVESEIRSLPELVAGGSYGLVINVDTKLPDMEIVSKYPEIQLMTVEIGKQGNDFHPEIGDKLEQLRSLGYTGSLSIDGGVNLNTASLISHWPVDRVSVGSFLQNSTNPELSLMKLDLALNLKSETI